MGTINTDASPVIWHVSYPQLYFTKYT